MTERIKTNSLLRDLALGVSGEIADAMHGAMGYDPTLSTTEEGYVYYEDKRETYPLTPNNLGTIFSMVDDYGEKLAAFGAEKVQIMLGKTGARVSIQTTPEVGEAMWETFETPYGDDSLPQVAS